MTVEKITWARRWLIMSCLCLSGGIIFLLPFLREVYYIPLQRSLELSNTQLGILMSVYGTVAMISYFPGGWLADRLSPRKLITVSMLMTGFAGLYFAGFPSFPLSIAVHAFWGLSTSLTFWAAMIKATRNWASRSRQGRAFGILESGRGIAEIASSTAFLALFASLGSGKIALSQVIILFSVTNILIGIMAWFTLEDDIRNDDRKRVNSLRISLIATAKVLKMPVVWLISLVILTAYSAYWGSYYFTPYATDVCKMSVVFGGTLGVGKMWIKPLSALGAGFFADRIGVSKAVSWFFLILIVSFMMFVIVPGKPGLVIFLMLNTAVASAAIFGLRGIYYALLEEGGVPLMLTGTVTGIVSVIGYTPDIYMPMLGGLLLDRYPGGLGYKYFFGCIAGLGFLGLIAALMIRKISYRIKINQNIL